MPVAFPLPGQEQTHRLKPVLPKEAQVSGAGEFQEVTILIPALSC